ncbi:MAG: chemotaxis protein CheW [Desulfuromonadaceae bacterium]|nr:chemotaxis protein CheW [Desulfuromonadaceae bacterium]
MPAITTSNRRFLIFRLQSSLYALDLMQVAEVRDPMHMWPIPSAPACYSGALNFHGTIIAVMNLAVFLGLPGCSQAGKIVVLNLEIASLAFLVDSVVRIVFEEEAVFGKTADNRLAAATLVLPEGEALQLDLEVLVNEAELGIQRNRQL